MMLRILKAKQERADHSERMARLVSLRQPDKPAPTEQEWLNAARALVWNGRACPPENLFAVKAVESAGAAFNSEGRLLLSWETHVFGRNSGHRFEKSHPHLTTRKWVDYRKLAPSEKPKHPMGMSQRERWLLMMEAAALDFNAATAAGAYGMWQILGEGATGMGFKDPLHMIEIMYQGHDGQFDCFIRFCKWKGCLKALVEGDWATFERLYNGGGHKGAYAAKLATAQAAARRTLA
jgi:hypothetical protein